jgi:hypothetical protein
MVDMEWALGIVALVKALLDDGDDVKVSNKVVEERIDQVIDNNDYLPTTLDEFDRRVVGTGVNT